MAADLGASDPSGMNQDQPEGFSFEIDGNRLVGLLNTPEHNQATSTIIIVHGYGKTDVVEGDGYTDLRAYFTRLGMNVFVWDKPGCGPSQGDFDSKNPPAKPGALNW